MTSMLSPINKNIIKNKIINLPPLKINNEKLKITESLIDQSNLKTLETVKNRSIDNIKGWTKANTRSEIRKGSTSQGLTERKKIRNSRRVPTRNKNHSFDVSTEDEIFNYSPELELKYNLLNDNKSKNIQLLNADYNLINHPLKRIEKSKRIFNMIYNIDDNYLKQINDAKGKKNLSLIDYQNNLMLLLSKRLSKDLLRKLSVDFKELRDLADKVKRIPHIDWNIIKQDIKKARSQTFLDKEFFEMNQIGKHYSKKKASSNIDRLAPFLPEYLVEKFKAYKIKY